MALGAHPREVLGLVTQGTIRARDALERVHDKQGFAKIPAIAKRLKREKGDP